MSPIESHTPETYFAPQSFRLAQELGVTAVEYDLDSIATIYDMAQNRLDRELPAFASESDFVLWSRSTSLNPLNWDKHYAVAPDNQSYVHASQLTLPRDMVESTQKAQIEARGTGVVEIPTNDLTGLLSVDLARALLTTPAEDARMIASPRAWGRQIMKAITEGPKAGTGDKAWEVSFAATVGQRFPDAIRVIRRINQ